MSRFIERLRAEKEERDEAIRRRNELKRRELIRAEQIKIAEEEQIKRQKEEERKEEVKRQELRAKFFKESGLTGLVSEMSRLLDDSSVIGPKEAEIGLQWFRAPSVVEIFLNLLYEKRTVYGSSHRDGLFVQREISASADHTGTLTIVGAGQMVLPYESWISDRDVIEECLEAAYKNPQRSVVIFEPSSSSDGWRSSRTDWEDGGSWR